MTNKQVEEGPIRKKVLRFSDIEGKAHRWTPKFVRQDIQQKELDRVAVDIAKLGIFQKKGVAIAPASAKRRRRKKGKSRPMTQQVPEQPDK